MGCIQRYAKEKKKDPKLYFKIPIKNRLFGSEIQMEDIQTIVLLEMTRVNQVKKLTKFGIRIFQLTKFPT